MATDMKQAHRRLIDEVFARGNFDVFDELCDPSYRGHDPVTGDTDLEGEKQNCRMYKTSFPDLAPTILGCYADGDTVVTHWRMTGTHRAALMGIPPTGRRCTVDGISVARFRGGKIVEEWVIWDALGLMRQLGVAPGAGVSAPESTERPQPHV